LALSLTFRNWITGSSEGIAVVILLGQNSPCILSTVQNTEYGDGIGINPESDQNSPFEPHPAQTRTQIFAQCSPFRQCLEICAGSFYALDIPQGTRGTAAICDVFVKIKKIVSRFRRKHDRTVHS